MSKDAFILNLVLQRKAAVSDMDLNYFMDVNRKIDPNWE